MAFATFNAATPATRAEKFQIRIVGRYRCWFGEFASGHESSGAIKDEKDRGGFVINQCVVLDRATLIGLLWSVHNENTDIRSAPVDSSQRPIDCGRWRGLSDDIGDVGGAEERRLQTGF